MKDLPQNEPPLGGVGLNGSSLCRNMGETSDYYLKPLHLSYLVVRCNLEEHLCDDWNQTYFCDLTFGQSKLWEKTTYIYTHPQVSSTARHKCCCFRPWRKMQPWPAGPARCWGFTERWKTFLPACKMPSWQETLETSGVGAPFFHDLYGDLKQNRKHWRKYITLHKSKWTTKANV